MFFASRHWMMHVGPEKGAILAGVLSDAIGEKARRTCQGEFDGCFAAIELRKYCRYVSVLIARTFCEAAPPPVNGQY